MAEAAAALASLGVPANIFQFLDLAGRVVARGWKIYRDPAGRIEDVFNSSTLRSLTQSLRGSLDLLSPNARDCEAGMVSVARNCSLVADELLRHLTRIEELRRSGKKRDALKAAVVSVWKQDELKALEERVEQFKSQLALQLRLSIRSFISPSNTQEQKEAAIQLHELQSSTAKAKTMLWALRENAASPWTTTPGPNILQYICSKVPKSIPGMANSSYALHQHLFEAIAANGEEVGTIYQLNELPPTNGSAYDRSCVQDRLQDRAQEVWKQDDMVDRLIQVSDAHIETFRWIFEPPSRNDKPWSDFSVWLGNMDAPLYWVTGKPGSGKSTLMKFILTHQDNTTSHRGTVVEALLPRAPLEPPWTIVHYYAWYAGQKLQKSVGGLCCSLVHQLAKRHPNVVPKLFPSCWEAMWLVNDLGPQQMALLKGAGTRTALFAAVYEVTKTHKIFFLIDGLDEIDGETEEAKALILELAELPKIKVCAASRPWPVFENAFRSEPHLCIQDLTKNDIIAFTTDKLSQGVGFSRLQYRNPGYASRLIHQVAEKSAGVFLWVALVVKSLTSGLEEDDRTVDLEQRIDAIPNDLNELFSRILTSLDVSHLNRAVRYFRLVYIHRQQYLDENLTALALSFADEKHPDFAKSMAIEPLSEHEVEERVSTMARRVESVSRGLLEIVKGPSSRESIVDYLHRTVVDFLSSKMALASLSMATKSHSDASLSIQLSSAYLCLLKGLQHDPQLLRTADCNMFTKLVYKTLSFARRAEMEMSQDEENIEVQIVQVLDQVDLTGTRLAKYASRNPDVSYLGMRQFYFSKVGMLREHTLRTLESGHWAWFLGIIGVDQIVRSIDSGDDPKTSGRTFLSIVVRAGICTYIKARAAPGCLVQRMDFTGSSPNAQASCTVWPLLVDALDNLHVDPSMVRQLLRLRSDPSLLFYFPSTHEQTTPLRLAISRAMFCPEVHPIIVVQRIRRRRDSSL